MNQANSDVAGLLRAHCPTPPELECDCAERRGATLVESQAARIAELEAALRPFVAAYVKAADPIGDSDLYPEQPRASYVTLGDCRTAKRVLGRALSAGPARDQDEGAP